MHIWTSFLKQLKHTPNFPVCCAFVSGCLVALRKMEIPLLLYCRLIVSSLSHLPLLVVQVRPTLRLVVYCQPVRLGDKILETHDK
jgi:hypothetical protein